MGVSVSAPSLHRESTDSLIHSTTILCDIPECMCIYYSLGSNNISDKGARAIADGMKYCTSLQTL